MACLPATSLVSAPSPAHCQCLPACLPAHPPHSLAPTHSPVPCLAALQVCYHGPCEAVLPFFEGLGFSCPVRRGVADFLQEVTTPSDQHVSGCGRSCGWQGSRLLRCSCRP